MYSKVAVLIPSRKVYSEVCNFYYKNDVFWCGGEKRGPGYFSKRRLNGDTMCITAYGGNELGYDRLHYFQRAGYKILTAKAFYARHDKTDYTKLPRRIRLRR
jgi:hypothetical protein